MKTNFAGKKIILGISGGIAAYKCAELVRELCRQKALVKVVMTKAAETFITPLTLQALSGQLVLTEQLAASSCNAMDHIELAKWADMVLIAPATADLIARLAGGHANDLLTTLVLATPAPVVLAPAMNQQMWHHPLTQKNIEQLRAIGVQILGPAAGEQACGDVGLGRMLEPLDLLSQICSGFSSSHPNAKKIIITAGPTRESLDPVRYLTNHSSGKMGYALAKAAVENGNDVILISGPCNLPIPHGLEFIAVTSAEQMYAAVMENIKESHIFIAAAAVADYRPVVVSTQKIKKQQEVINLTLQRNPDILQAVAAQPSPPFTVGFAAETENLLKYAKSKLVDKQLDMVIANQVGEQQGFNADENTVTVIIKNGKTLPLSLMSKVELARKLIMIIDETYKLQTPPPLNKGAELLL